MRTICDFIERNFYIPLANILVVYRKSRMTFPLGSAVFIWCFTF
nr:MAG TPA: hypothetical protein [Microviridae sp.]